MSAYLKFFQLEKCPFENMARGGLVLGTRALRAAFAEIERGLEEGAPRICLDGKAGMGKTSLARALPKLLAQSARVVLLPSPEQPWPKLRSSIVRQLELEQGVLSRKTLAKAVAEGRRIVLVIDQAELISQEALEHLDILLSYRSDEDTQLVHCVLLANLENAGQNEERSLLWWLDSLTTLQLEYAPIPASGIESYINKHLKRAGWNGDQLFTPEAMRAIHRLTGGVPRSVSELCERVLGEAAERSLEQIGPDLLEELCEAVAPDVPDESTCGGEVPAAEEPGATAAADGPPSAHAAAVAFASTAKAIDTPDESAAAADEPESETATQPQTSINLDAFFAASADRSGRRGAAREDEGEEEPEEPWPCPEPPAGRRVGRWLAAVTLVAVLTGGGYAALQGGLFEGASSPADRPPMRSARLPEKAGPERGQTKPEATARVVAPPIDPAESPVAIAGKPAGPTRSGTPEPPAPELARSAPTAVEKVVEKKKRAAAPAHEPHVVAKALPSAGAETSAAPPAETSLDEARSPGSGPGQVAAKTTGDAPGGATETAMARTSPPAQRAGSDTPQPTPAKLSQDFADPAEAAAGQRY